MAGFVALYEMGSSPQKQEENFQKLVDFTTQFKDLKNPYATVLGVNYSAAKLDAPASLHRGVLFDELSGSWVLAAGTVVALEGNNDPETLLKDLLVGYLDYGVKVLNRYDGHFGLVIYNTKDQSLSIISDPLGLFTIFYSQNGRQVLISNSALAIAHLEKSKPDSLVIECFLRAGRVHGEKTLWQGVKRVRPSTLIKITPEKFEEFEYWKPKIDSNIASLSLNGALEMADEKIKNLYKKIFTREENIWADLTGGFDTRVTTMYLAKMGFPFTAYCFGQIWHPDVMISKEISQKLGWQYLNISLPDNWEHEQISLLGKAIRYGDGHLNVIQLASTLRILNHNSLIDNVHVAGGGVDEWRFHVFGSKIFIPTKNTQINYEDIINSRIVYNIPMSVMRSNRSLEVRKEILDHLTRLQQGFDDWNELAKTDLMFMKHRHPLHGGAYLSSQSSIGRTILPFCFKELQNFGLSLKHSWRLNYHFAFVRHLLEKSCPSLAKIRTVIGGSTEPIRLSNIYKFLPLGKYLLGHFLGKVKINNIGKNVGLITPHQRIECTTFDWRKRWLDWAVSEDLLNPQKMISGELYHSANLLDLVSQEQNGFILSEEFLQRVITVEMALRISGTEM